ncbi:MAG: flagellar hook-length control protein FliK [Pirellulales bacterium]
MNHAQIDHLLQATATRPEAFSNSARSRESAPPFDNHFRQASAGSTTTAPASGSAPASPQSSAANSEDDERGAKATPITESTTDTVSKPAVGGASSIEPAEESRDDSTDDRAENAEVAALLAAEQAPKPAASESPAAALHAKKSGVEGNHAAGKVAADAKSRSNKPEKQPVSTTPSSTDDKPSDAEDQLPASATAADSARATAKAAADVTSKARQENGAAPAAATKAAATDPETESKPGRSERRQEKSENPKVAAVVAEAANPRQAAKSAAPQSTSAKSSPVIERREGATKTDKKVDARSDVSAGDADSVPVERPAVVTRTVETATGAVAAAANVQQPLAADAGGAASTSNAAAKASGSATEGKPGLLSSLQRLDRSTAGASRGTHRAGGSEGAPHVDPARFVSRVARAVQTAQERGGPLQLRLSPPELGAMRIELSVHQGALTATIETDNTNAKQLLLDNLAQLRDRLADQNVKIERFDVDVRQDSSSSQQNYTPQDREQMQRQSSALGGQPNTRRPSAAATLDEPPPVRRTISNTSINVVA